MRVDINAHLSAFVQMADGDRNKKTYTLAEVAEQNSSESLWLVMDKKVYDVTKFLEEVPLFRVCAIDWTLIFCVFSIPEEKKFF